MDVRFDKRSAGLEIMDDLDCSGEVVFQTLRELEIINRLLGGNQVTINGLNKLLIQPTDQIVAVADLGCGGGDILKLVSRWGMRKKISFQLHGIDANPNIVEFARNNTPADMNIQYNAVNIFSEQFREKKYDVVLATLFTHHFSDQELISLLRSLRNQTVIGIVINDIHRHWLAYYSIKFLTGLFSKSSMVKFDAPLSVLRAFSRKDLESILRQAGIQEFSLRWRWAFRWQLIIPCRQPS